MRLIDADALCIKFSGMYKIAANLSLGIDEQLMAHMALAISMTDNAPTIIETEEPCP